MTDTPEQQPASTSPADANSLSSRADLAAGEIAGRESAAMTAAKAMFRGGRNLGHRGVA